MNLLQDRPKEFPFYMAPRLKEKLDLMVDRLKRQDVWIILDGDEGAGKTNMEAYLLYYFAWKTGRKFGINNLFYEVEKLREEAQRTENGLYGWDEGAIGGLSTQWFTQAQTNLIQFAMTGRTLHHVIIICIPKFDKLKDYLIRDRSVCLINCYKKNGKEDYRYMYLTINGKERLYNTWKKTKLRFYGKYMQFGGWTPEVFSKIFTEEEQKEYERRKREMISQIGTAKQKLTKADIELAEIKARLAKADYLSMQQKEEILKKSRRTIGRLALDAHKEDFSLGKDGFEPVQKGNIIKQEESDMDDDVEQENDE